MATAHSTGVRGANRPSALTPSCTAVIAAMAGVAEGIAAMPITALRIPAVASPMIGQGTSRSTCSLTATRFLDLGRVPVPQRSAKSRGCQVVTDRLRHPPKAHGKPHEYHRPAIGRVSDPEGLLLQHETVRFGIDADADTQAL